MRVNLFSDSDVLNNSARIGKQMETRKFQRGSPIEGVRDVLQEYPPNIVQSYIDHLQRVLEGGRVYEFIGCSGCDSVWELECLGVGEYTREYTVVVDFSETLDYLLLSEFGCAVGETRAIDDYVKVSRGMLNFNFENINASMGTLFINSPQLMTEMSKMMQELMELLGDADISIDEKVSHFVFNMYSRILGRLSAIKDYVAADLQQQNPKQLIYRSKNYSSIILTSDVPLSGELILRQRDLEDYCLNVHSYKRYEWAREGIIHEIVRNAQHR